MSRLSKEAVTSDKSTLEIFLAIFGSFLPPFCPDFFDFLMKNSQFGTF